MESKLRELKESVLEQIDMSREQSDTELEEQIEESYQAMMRGKIVSLKEHHRYATEAFNSLRKLGVLQELVEDEEVTEILVNGPANIYYEKAGELYSWDKQFEDEEELISFAQMMVGVNNRMVNASNPIVDGRLSDGARVNIVLSPISVDGTAISIRRFPKEPMKMKQLMEYQALSGEMAEFLKRMVRSGYNIFISGGTGTGKTTFLNALSEFIPQSDRVITIEDSAELQLNGIPNLVRLETRVAGIDGVKEISIRELIRTALRMRPTRIIVGECRGGEALDMLQALNTGHSGSLSTGHANSSEDMLKRLETMVLMGMDLPIPAIRGQIASGIDLLVHLGRMRDRSRKVLEISEVDGICNGEIQLHNIFVFQETGMKNGRIQGEWSKVGELKHLQKAKAAGQI